MQQRHLKEGGVPEEVSDSMRGCGDTKLLTSPLKNFSIRFLFQKLEYVPSKESKDRIYNSAAVH